MTLSNSEETTLECCQTPQKSVLVQTAVCRFLNKKVTLTNGPRVHSPNWMDSTTLSVLMQEPWKHLKTYKWGAASKHLKDSCQECNSNDMKHRTRVFYLSVEWARTATTLERPWALIKIFPPWMAIFTGKTTLAQTLPHPHKTLAGLDVGPYWTVCGNIW